jgi:hypothetical protein
MVRAAIGTVPLAKNCKDQMIIDTQSSCSITVITGPICANFLEIWVPQLSGTLRANPDQYIECCPLT